MMRDDPEIKAWFERARAGSFETAIELCGFVPRRGDEHKKDRAGPCPACGGVDRFSVNLAKRVFNCRGGCGARGKNALSLALVGERLTSVQAAEALTGEDKPGGLREESAGEKSRRLAAAAQKRIEEERRQAERAAEAEQHREKEIARALKIWEAGRAIGGTLAQAYLAFRGCALPDEGALRFLPALPYWRERDGAFEELFAGPAMLAPILREGRISGVHITWLDPALDGGRPANKGKRLILDEDGERLDSRKVRGAKKGGHVPLVMPFAGLARRKLIIGEGIETVLFVRRAMLAHAPEKAEAVYATSVDLGNLTGKAAGTVRHPDKRPDKNGVLRFVQVRNDVPAEEDEAFSPDAAIEEVTLLADADGDVFSVEQGLRRAARRMARPGRTVRIAWPEPGFDFNAMGMAA